MSPSTAVWIAFRNEHIKEMFALDPNFRQNLILNLFSDGGGSLLAT